MVELPCITFVLGTRPEAIKLTPVIKLFQKCKLFRTRVVLSGQHREMVDSVMDLFKVNADFDLNLMSRDQNISSLTGLILNGLREEFYKFPPCLVFVQGDTTTAFSASLAAFYEQIPVAHIEAGLRTNNWLDPHPEEVNRRLISQLAQLHFAPTSIARENLIDCKVLGEIFVTGNTVLDALELVSNKLPSNGFKDIDWETQRVILTTVHRNENRGKHLIEIAKGLKKVIDFHLNVTVLLPLHRNPKVRQPLESLLKGHPRIILTESLEYNYLLAVIRDCTLLLTDSGGLQEEAHAFGKQILILRGSTERPEAIHSGMAKLIGTSSEMIFSEVTNLLGNQKSLEGFINSQNPFGDGRASERILEASLRFLDL